MDIEIENAPNINIDVEPKANLDIADTLMPNPDIEEAKIENDGRSL